MSNPTFRQGPIGFEVESAVEQFRLVTVNANGKVEHASADGAVFGAVTEKRDASNPGSSDQVAVHYGVAAVKIEVDGEASDIKAGAAVFAAADGKVSSAGSVQVGVAARDGEDTRVLVVLNRLPSAGTNPDA